MTSRIIKAFVIVICVSAIFSGVAAAQSGHFPSVVLAADGSGDYGPQTPGTLTSGWQEALNFCTTPGSLGYGQDLYVKGGGNFTIDQTIHIPATQDFRIDGGVYTMTWTGPAGQDMLWVDSVMDLHLTMGALIYNGTGAAIRFKAQNPVPIDGFAAWVDSEVRITSITGAGAQQGVGVVFENCVHADFYFGAIRNLATCVAANGVSLSHIRCVDLRTNVANGTLMSLGGSQNIVEVGIGVNDSATNVTGVNIGGSNNKVDVRTNGGFAAGRNVVLGGSGNQVNLIQASTVADPLALVTDAGGANQLTWVGGAIPMQSIPIAAGTYTYTQRIYTATVRVVGGTPSSIRLLRGSGVIDYGSSRTDVPMSIGDQLQVTTSDSATIQIVPRSNG